MRKKKQWLAGYGFISLWLIGLFVFTLIPMIYSFYISLTEWDFIGTPRFIGLKNYMDIMKDSTAKKALINTAYYTAVSVPLRMILALTVALMLSKPYKGSNGLRVLFYMPGIISVLQFLPYGPGCLIRFMAESTIFLPVLEFRVWPG